MLEHVQIGGDVLKVPVLVGVEHHVHEVNVPAIGEK